LSESRLGARLASGSSRLRAEKLSKLSTKCGRVIRSRASLEAEGIEGESSAYEGQFITDAYHSDRPVADYSADAIKESFSQSCSRLQRQTLDVLRLHDCEGEERYEAALRGKAVEAMLELKQDGKVGEIGLGMGSSDYAEKLLTQFPPGTFDSVMLAGCWNLIDQDGLNVLKLCQRLGVKVVNVGIFASGVLWGGDHYKYGDIPQDVADKVSGWKELADKHNLKLPQVALAFALLPETVDRVAIGCSTAKEVRGNVELCGKEVPTALWREARARGLLPEEVPIPEP